MLTGTKRTSSPCCNWDPNKPSTAFSGYCSQNSMHFDFTCFWFDHLYVQTYNGYKKLIFSNIVTTSSWSNQRLDDVSSTVHLLYPTWYLSVHHGSATMPSIDPVKSSADPLLLGVFQIFPCLLIYTVSFLGFFLPAESGEKVNLEITILLALVVFLLMVGETLPPTPDAIPALGTLFNTHSL